MAAANLLYYGDNHDVLNQHIKDESVDLVLPRSALQLESPLQYPVSPGMALLRQRRFLSSRTPEAGTNRPPTTHGFSRIF
jgi:hypothetical protein